MECTHVLHSRSALARAGYEVIPTVPTLFAIVPPSVRNCPCEAEDTGQRNESLLAVHPARYTDQHASQPKRLVLQHRQENSNTLDLAIAEGGNQIKAAS